MTQVVDLIVETRNPTALDAVVQQLGPACVIESSFNGTTAHVRCFGNAGFIKFAIDNQGYGKVVGEAPVCEIEGKGGSR